MGAAHLTNRQNDTLGGEGIVTQSKQEGHAGANHGHGEAREGGEEKEKGRGKGRGKGRENGNTTPAGTSGRTNAAGGNGDAGTEVRAQLIQF